MKVAVLGSGVVGRTLAAKIASLGHTVAIGTRDPEATLSRPDTGPMTPEPFAAWHAAHPGIAVERFATAAADAGVVFNATSGHASLDALGAAGDLAGRLLVDTANPLDFSSGELRLFVSNTESLAERIQAAFPAARVVKALNTVNASLMVDPGSLGDGAHDIFVCGDDPSSREQVSGILRDWFGWRHVTDLGDLTAARGLEMYLPLWVRMMGTLGTPRFNIRLVR